ncbi:MAG: hypothetical protein JNK05_12170 [Myxococcales bacterium]|nr:hypothetical protein [Myxococcales bacterium]
MGLRDYEFDAAPELLAAVARGRPGPLMDAAMAHMSNVAQAAREAAQREQNERDRAAVEAEEASIAASLEEVSTNVGNGVNRGGAFSSTSVGGSVGDVNRMGSDLADPTRGLGNVGFLPGGTKGLGVRGVGIQDFIQGQILGGTGMGRVQGGGPAVPASTPEQEAQDLVNYHEKLMADQRRRGGRVTQAERNEEQRAFNAAQHAVFRVISLNGGVLPAGLSTDHYLRTVAVRQAMHWWINTRHRPAPDETVDSSTVTPATALLLFKYLQSMGGLVEGSMESGSSGAINRPDILDAVDDSDSVYELNSPSTQMVRWWMLNLVDPTPR